VNLKPSQEPPPVRYRASVIGQAEAAAAYRMLVLEVPPHEWVSDGAALRTRPSAAHRAKRLLRLLAELPGADGLQFTSKTWCDGNKWRWAIRLTDSAAPSSKGRRKK
jgi:hypothetical protein